MLCVLCSYYSAITIFVSPDFGDDIYAFLLASVEPGITLFVACMHQSFTWCDAHTSHATHDRLWQVQVPLLDKEGMRTAPVQASTHACVPRSMSRCSCFASRVNGIMSSLGPSSTTLIWMGEAAQPHLQNTGRKSAARD